MKRSDGVLPSRRKFLKQTAALGGWAVAQGLVGCKSQSTQQAPSSAGANRSVAIIPGDDPMAASAPGKWAMDHLRKTIVARGVDCKIISWRDDMPGADIQILANGTPLPVSMSSQVHQDAAESFLIQPQSQRIVVAYGRDERGLVYALTELADLVEHSDDPLSALSSISEIHQYRANRIRSVMRCFVSDVEDKAWYYDRQFWQDYLTNLVTQRFNRFNLAMGVGYDAPQGLADAYFFFAYPFLLSVPGYDVRVDKLSDAERDKNLEMLKFISDQAALRGLDFNLGIWTHAYEWIRSPNVNYVVTGLTAEKHADYCRDAMTMLLKECPSITGITLRTHGESGVAEGNYDFWKTVYSGIAASGRKIEIDMHAKGLDQKMIDTAVQSGLPVTLSPKFWAEHQGLPYHQSSIRELELPKATNARGAMALSNGTRSFLRYGYGDLMREDRPYKIIHRIWPGTQHLLLSGDPHFEAEYAKCFSFCGSDGFEMFDPLGFKGRKGSGLPGGRNAYADKSLQPAEDWQKYRYTYRLWGRLSYDPKTSPDVWRREMSNAKLESALAQCSRILPLVTSAHCPSAANANYTPEMYTNMSMVEPRTGGPYTDTPTPRVFGTVSSLDPQIFATIQEYSQSLLSQKPLAKVSPRDVAAQLALWGSGAMSDLSELTDPGIRREVIDARIAAGLGSFFAWKFRAGVLFSIFSQTAHEPARQEALFAYRKARTAWADLSALAATVYVKDITFGDAPQIRGSWQDRLPAIDQDIAAVENYVPKPAKDSVPVETIAAAMAQALSSNDRWQPQLLHTPPAAFRSGQPVALEISGDALPASVRLAYRRMNHAETYKYLDMDRATGKFTASIDGTYSASPYPLQYYFEVQGDQNRAAIFPGFEPGFTGQPYYVIRQG